MVQSPAAPVVVVVAAVVAAACGLKANNMYQYQPSVFIYPTNREV
jgi:hypothetical protein